MSTKKNQSSNLDEIAATVLKPDVLKAIDHLDIRGVDGVHLSKNLPRLQIGIDDGELIVRINTRFPLKKLIASISTALAALVAGIIAILDAGILVVT